MSDGDASLRKAKGAACVLRLRKLGDVVAGVLQGDEVATARERYRIVKATLPLAISHSRAVAIVPNPNRARISAPPSAA
jgi:hypothetical protein